MEDTILWEAIVRWHQGMSAEVESEFVKNLRIIAELYGDGLPIPIGSLFSGTDLVEKVMKFLSKYWKTVYSNNLAYETFDAI